ncbi:unnamed protein product [Mytilus coruscus]|uniref:Uncharacterized protein n=1 Tax=Mytilus coruscus TaxID=42192 RepID=A0A6J8BJK7_MYTCO|nr:unnamed protein product [Mytilus coruscus]
MNQNIFQVRVSIYKNGVEKAFMLFNATAADKMRWFTSSRIIDSSWVDLQSTTKQYFAMFQDPYFLREFYASQNADKSKCDSTGWMFISTENRCFMETEKKPAFYYAQGQTSAHWGYSPHNVTLPNVITTAPSTKGYVLLMKGVTGVGTYPPGVTDLFELWNSTKTINEFQPEALALTPNFPGHYKPILSNNWTGLCLYKVRVSIYKNGVEKAFMLFNATGADKMSWFTPGRIIDSSWVDLQSTTKQYFAMSQDPDFLREFYVSQNADQSKCDSTGWMFISTANRCYLEFVRKPAFYYAPGQNSAHWGYSPDNVSLPKVITTVPSVQLTSMLSLQCVTYVLNFSTISTSNKYVIITMCNLCPKPSVPSVQVTTLSPKGYVLLMKGVTGVGTYPPGITDLFELWNSTKTINEFKPGANSLTPNFPGHYKPILSNNWPGLCLDKIINKLDPDFFREFYASQNADKSNCDSTGLMFISTVNRCFIETDKKPAFYYAPGQTSAHWGYSPNNVSLPKVITTANTCVYKGRYYGQDGTWIDGCKYKCECRQANLGFYRCKELCYEWYLSSPCTLNDPAPGKCCKTPSCPPWITMQYPPEYKEE